MAFTKNQILQLEIESLSSDGNGVATATVRPSLCPAPLREILPGCASSNP